LREARRSRGRPILGVPHIRQREVRRDLLTPQQSAARLTLTACPPARAPLSPGTLRAGALRHVARPPVPESGPHLVDQARGDPGGKVGKRVPARRDGELLPVLGRELGRALNDPAGIPGCDRAGGNVGYDNASRTDDRVVSNGHARQDDRRRADVDPTPYRHCAHAGITRVAFRAAVVRQDGHPAPEEALVADRDEPRAHAADIGLAAEIHVSPQANTLPGQGPPIRVSADPSDKPSRQATKQSLNHRRSLARSRRTHMDETVVRARPVHRGRWHRMSSGHGQRSARGRE
jgi:hypothetical protein